MFSLVCSGIFAICTKFSAPEIEHSLPSLRAAFRHVGSSEWEQHGEEDLMKNQWRGEAAELKQLLFLDFAPPYNLTAG